MLYYKIPFTEGSTFTYPPAVLLRSYYKENHMFCEFESVTEVPEEWQTITSEEFESGWTFPSVTYVDKTVVTKTVSKSEGDTISVHVTAKLENGLRIQFAAPCDATGIKKLIVQGQSLSQSYSLVDKYGNVITGNNDFLENTIVTVELNTILNTAAVVGVNINSVADQIGDIEEVMAQL